MQAHALPLAGPSGPRLVPDRVRDAEPPEVVDQPGAAQRARLASASPSARAGRRGELRDGARVAERVRRLQVDEVGDRQQRRVDPLARRARRRARARRRSPRPRSPTASRSPRIASSSSRTSAASTGSNWRPARRCGRAPGRRDAADSVRDLDELGDLRDARGERDASPARRPASPSRPTARTRRRARPHLAGSPSCAASARASSAWWLIMSSTSRRPETANSSPIRNRCSGGFPAPSSRSVARAAQAAQLVVVLAGLSAMSSPNHFACSWASVWQPTLTSSAV